jgi:hypothetical protein
LTSTNFSGPAHTNKQFEAIAMLNWTAFFNQACGRVCAAHTLENLRDSPLAEFEEPTISVYENETPAFIAPELDRLYGSLFSSLMHFRIYKGADKASTYVVCDRGEALAILLFIREGRTVRVVNEGIKVGAQEISRFAEYVFDRYESVNTIAFQAVQAEIQRFSYAHHRFFFTEDFILHDMTTSGLESSAAI